MHFSQIKQLYPTAILKDSAQAEKDTLTYPYKNKWIHLNKEHLSENEQVLLGFLLSNRHEIPSPSSDWFLYLNGEKVHPPYTLTPIRMIQLKLEKKDSDFNASLWLESLRQLFDPILDVFFYSKERCLVIQRKEAPSISSEEIQGILQTVEEDFSVRTRSYIGQYWNVNENLYLILNEELSIFEKEGNYLSEPITSLPKVSAQYFMAENVRSSSIMQELKNLIVPDEEWKELIQAMWENQGNVSMAAKSLYVHRNTLQYRIDKFYEQTQFSLKNMNELLLCYLLIL